VFTVCPLPIVVDDGHVANNNDALYTSDMNDSMRTPLATPPLSRHDHLSALPAPSMTLPTRRIINNVDGEFTVFVCSHALLEFADRQMTNPLAVPMNNLPVNQTSYSKQGIFDNGWANNIDYLP
jgi:hypothetical protein